MENVFIVVANILLSLCAPYAVCSLIISQYERSAERIGLGEQDALMRFKKRCRIVRGAKLIAAMRKTMSGVVCGLFLVGLIIGIFGGNGPLVLFWFIECVIVALMVDFFNRNKRRCELWPVGE